MSHPTPWRHGHGQINASMLASHADRERTVDVLRAGFGEGRLLKDELEQRVARAYAARTVGELAHLVADLPQGPVPMPAVVMPAPFIAMAPPPPTNGKAVGALVCGLATLVTFGVTGVPALVLGYSARAEIRRTGEGGDGLAEAGMVLGWIAVAGWAVCLILIMVFMVV